MRAVSSKSAKVRDYFINNPDAVPKVVGKKFKCAMPVVYKIRKEVLDVINIMDDEPKPTAKAFTEPLRASDRQVGGDHYKNMGVEPWDVVDTWTREQRIGYYRGGALKYIMRMGAKDESPTEVAKGKHYMEKLLEVLGEPDA